jgi:hypothetical protein
MLGNYQVSTQRMGSRVMLSSMELVHMVLVLTYLISITSNVFLKTFLCKVCDFHGLFF